MVGSTLTTHHDSQTSATIEREPVLMSITPSPANRATCHACKEGVSQPFPFSMAFQPIVDVRSGTPYAYEALVRGPKGEGANSILSQVNPENIYAFDQNCRVRAISLAARLNLPATGAALSINFMPGAVYSPSACIQLTLQTARQVDFPLDRLIFEVTEVEEIRDRPHLKTIVDAYRDLGFRIALDDFGAGHSGLNLLASFPPTSSSSTWSSPATCPAAPPPSPSSTPWSASPKPSTPNSSPKASKPSTNTTPSATPASTSCRATSSPDPPSKPSPTSPGHRRTPQYTQSPHPPV
jgi:EAL domain-containing protein (putative c-di-GMP-specific phosphodiesterase class I)